MRHLTLLLAVALSLAATSAHAGQRARQPTVSRTSRMVRIQTWRAGAELAGRPDLGRVRDPAPAPARGSASIAGRSDAALPTGDQGDLARNRWIDRDVRSGF